MAVVPVQPKGSSGIPLDMLTEILLDLASATGIFQSVKGEISQHRASKVYSELEKMARILMDDTARANEIIRAHQNNRDDIVQTLVGSSPVGSRIQILRKKLNEERKMIDKAEKDIARNNVANENITSYQRSADAAADMYGKGSDFRDAKTLTKEKLNTPESIRNYFEHANYPESKNVIIASK